MRKASGWLLIAGAVVVALHACGRDEIGAPPEGTIFVKIGDASFEPQTVAVARGRSARWTNGGAVLHSVVSDAGLWQSTLLQPTRWFEVRFDEPGTFTYHCSVHPGATGTVIVQ